MAKVARKTSTRGKPKSVKNASAKRVKRTPTTAAKRATPTQTAASPAAAAKATARNTAFAADNVIRMGTEALQQMMKGTNLAEPNKIIERAGQESMAQFTKSADVASRSMNEAFHMGKEQVDTAVACGSIAAAASKHIGSELFSYANKSFSQNVELSKEIMSCRTLNDMFDLQSKMMKANLDNFFSESVKMSELMFDVATKVSEPLNEQVSGVAKRISKTLSEAA